MKISIIIPVLNEASLILKTLERLQPLRDRGHEVIVVDGGSTDGSPDLASPYVDKVLFAARGRARQMNAGASVATGDVLLFLHADTFLPDHADRLILERLETGRWFWGRFDVRLSGTHLFLRAVEVLMNWRSRVSSIATGDQALFLRRDLFERVGGFKPVDLMEDIELSKTLKRYGRPLCLSQRVTTSSRRWEAKGILRTIFLMWFLRLAYFFKASPDWLAKRYDP